MPSLSKTPKDVIPKWCQSQKVQSLAYSHRFPPQLRYPSRSPHAPSNIDGELVVSQSSRRSTRRNPQYMATFTNGRSSAKVEPRNSGPRATSLVTLDTPAAIYAERHRPSFVSTGGAHHHLCPADVPELAAAYNDETFGF